MMNQADGADRPKQATARKTEVAGHKPDWTTADDIKAQVQKLWDRGLILGAMAGGESVFPLRLPLKGPASRELSERFAEVRAWIAQLAGAAGDFRLEWRQVNHRVLGTNNIPAAIWIDQPNDALNLSGQRKAADQFAVLVAQTRQEQPGLLPWLIKRPLRASELTQEWPLLLTIVGWMIKNPRPMIYLRQIDLPGVHTKLIEAHRGVLAELFDLVLPAEQIDETATGLGGFCRRYGFRDKPARVRFRLLDPNLRLLQAGTDQDITVTEAAFAAMELPVSKVFITENEINFLTFPAVSDALLIFGSGYGFDHLATATWLQQKAIFYWGDIDTHGFAILNQLRRLYPHTRSILMDQATFMAHQIFWGTEDQPETGNLTGLSDEEARLYNLLRDNILGKKLRLEQEKIGFTYLLTVLRRLS